MEFENLVIDPAIRCEIEALIVEHSWKLDHHKSGNLGDLYIETGKLTGIGGDRIGREAISDYGRTRASNSTRQCG